MPKSDAPSLLLHEMFQKQAHSTPEATAIFSDRTHTTFRELNQQSNKLARYLRRRGVLPETRVAVHLEQSIETVVAILGIVKAGGAYVAIDPRWPISRVNEVLAVSGISLLAIDANRYSADIRFSDQVLILPNVLYDRESPADLATNTMIDNLLNVAYTSGTTGKPQGVLVPVRSAVSRIRGMSESYAFKQGDIALLHRAPSMIGFSSDCFAPLASGIPLFLIEERGARDPLDLIRQSIQRGVSHVSASPALLEAIVEYLERHPTSWPTLRVVRTSGDRLLGHTVEKWRRLLPGVSLLNVYGATECGGTTLYDTAMYQPSTEGRVPVGRSVPEASLYVLDEEMCPLAFGTAGDIYIGGPHLARGYADSPGLTAQRFLPNPDPARPGERLFRTNDIGVLWLNGDLEIIGRRDRQVKIRGFRVAMEEVEAALGDCVGVRAGVVETYKNNDGANAMVAYIVSDTSTLHSPRAIRASMSKRLPLYMVPTQFVFIKAMPMTPTGKVDRRALSSLPCDKVEFRADYVAPRTSDEQLVTAIWADVFGIEHPGIDDDLFDLGGDSLLATRIASQVAESSGIALTVRVVFEHPTIRTFAEALSDLKALVGNALDTEPTT